MTAPKLLFTLDQPHGLGELYFVWQKGESRSLIATTGTDASVAVHDRSGQLVERIKLQGLCGGMEWDNDGDILAVITPNSHSVVLWECHVNKRLNIDTGLRESPSCIAWAYGEPLLAVGTQKGNLALYNHHTTKRIPIVGKHTKKITCAAWNKDSILVLGSEDKTLSINNADGDTLRMISLRDVPNDLQFSEMKTDERAAGENTISLVVGKRTLYLYNLLNPENPIELAFQQRYGSIVSYSWYGDGYILIGFSAGYVISISTHIKEVGEELFQVKNHKDSLTSVAVHSKSGLAATCGDGQVKLISLWNGGATTSTLTETGQARAGWGCDGRLLAAAGSSAHVYVAALPALHCALGTRVAALTSLGDVTVYQCVADGGEEGATSSVRPLGTYSMGCEPALLALGGSHVYAARGAAVWAAALAGGTRATLHGRTTVTQLVAAAGRLAALAGGKATLYTIEPTDPSEPDRESKMFPEPHMEDAYITSIQLTSDFFVFVTERGHIEYFSLEEWRASSRYQHAAPLRAVHCDITGARACVLEDTRALVYSVAYQDLVPVEQMPYTAKGVIWDICLSERNVFVAYTDEVAATFYYAPHSVLGPHVEHVATTSLPTGYVPLVLFAGDAFCYVPGGSITKLSLDSHTTPGLGSSDAGQRATAIRRHASKLAKLRRWQDAASAVSSLGDGAEEDWRQLAAAALASLQLDFAIRVYTKLNDVAMVWALEDASHIEELTVLCGVLSVCLGRTDSAVQWLQRGEAGARWLAELWCAAGQWGRAAQLVALAPPLLARHASHLELTADYHEALSKYESSLYPENEDDSKIREHNANCEAGIARMSIRCGDYIRGITLAMKHSQNKTLLKECADLLEEEKQYGHAATLYDQAGLIEKAAFLYIKIKSWLKVEALLPKINSPSIHIQYAKAKEAEGRYSDALKSYLKAQDYESAIRLNLEKLDDIDEAVALVQETKSVQGAKMVANYFQNTDDPTSAIKFLVISLCYDEAFQLARKNGKLHLYGDILIQTSQARPEDFKSLALHFEGEKNHLLAGKYYFHAGEHAKAIGHLLKTGGSEGDENEAITIAIDAAAASDDERLTRRLIEFLLGETDGTPREPKHLFRLYMAKKQYNEAAKTAVIISGAEMSAGRYRGARDVLRDMTAQLRAQHRPPRDVRRALHATHRYVLVRSHVRRERHDLAATLLIQIASEIDFFPTKEHQVSILTSTVIECNRAGMKHAAHHWAKVLMQPEYRSQIDPKYSRVIESCVRHVPRGAATAAAVSRCVACRCDLPRHLLHCARCQAELPMCIATGFHIEAEDLTACPECDFPAIMSEFVELLKDDGKCPMCDENVDYRKLVKIDDVTPYLDLNVEQ